MTKTVKVILTGNKQEIFDAQVYLKMVNDYSRLGIPSDKALIMVGQLLANRPDPKKNRG